MWKLRRVLTLLGVGAATAFAAFALPMSAAHAADGVGSDGVAPGWEGGPYETCAGAVCLVMGDENLANWQYSGIRPYFTDWNGTQDYNVQHTSDDGSVTDAGTYNIKIEDIWSPFYSSSDYEFGDFAPNADAPDSLDLGWFGDLSGATIHKLSFFDGAITNLMINNVGPHDVSYWVVSTPDYTNTLLTADGVSADFIQYGDSDPMFLWNSLFHSGLDEAQVPDYLVPADPFAGIDFDPSQYLADALIS